MCWTRCLPWILLAGLWVPRPADAQHTDLERARAAFKEAEMHFKLGEFKKALPMYKEAFRAKAMPEFLFNIGQCHRHLGDCTRANFFFRQYLTQVPGTPHKTKVMRMVTECEAVIKNQQPGPAPVKPKPDPIKPKPDPVEPQPGAARKPLSRIWFWTGVGVTGALFATAAVTGALARSKNSDYLDETTPFDDRRGLKDSGETLETVCWTTVGVGAAAAAATAVLFWLSRPNKIEQTTSQVSPFTLSAAATDQGGAVLFSVRY